jgi:hypothetical protein
VPFVVTIEKVLGGKFFSLKDLSIAVAPVNLEF